MVESAVDCLQGMKVEQGVQVVTYAFLLGNVTLAKFFKSIDALPNSMRKEFRDNLTVYLEKVVKLD